MTKPERLLRLVVAASVAAPFLLLGSPASAAPDNTKVSKVFELPCAASVCDSSEDSSLSEGAVVEDSIQVHVTARSTLGLDSVELQARQVISGDASAWVCLRYWSSPGSNVSREYNWTTSRWPETTSGCDSSSFHGDLTRNATYDLRVIARDASGSTVSPLFSVKVSNAAETPEWVAEPVVEGAKERNPIVELRWRESPEPDAREYHFLRDGPNGEREYAVSATKPGGQGCEKDGDIFICYDDDFSSEGFGGDYSYTVLAMRASPSSRQSCSLPPYGDCIESSQSDSRSTSIEEPAAPGRDADPPPRDTNWNSTSKPAKEPARVPPAPRPGGRAPSGGSSAEFFQGEFDESLPYDPPGGFDLPGGEGTTPVAIGPDGEPIFATDTSGRTRALKVLALGLLLLLVAAHLARLLRDPDPA